ncbi:MAG: pseudouridine synthase [Lachnospirales bacterium]
MERLQKYMAYCGVASRRKCEDLILAGSVTVNDNIVTELGFKVGEGDEVRVNSELIGAKKNIYIMLNKPIGYVSTVSDELERKTILDLIGTNERIYPIGRLDIDTSGLLLLTNDGVLTHKLTHPKHNVNKTYIATVQGTPSQEEILKFKNGLLIDNYRTSPAEIKILKKGKNSTLEIKIHEGRNRQVRKMCSKIGHSVITLKRVAIGDLELNDLKEGTYRELNTEEVQYLNSLDKKL